LYEAKRRSRNYRIMLTKWARLASGRDLIVEALRAAMLVRQRTESACLPGRRWAMIPN